jgi:hypothetical protein
MRHLLILASLLFGTAATADEADFDFKSLGARKAVRDYKATLAKEDKAKQKAIEEMEAEAKKAQKKYRVELIMNLEQALKKALQDADLEEANKIDAAIKALKKGASPAGASVAGSKGKKKAKKSKARIPRNAVKWNGHHYWVSNEGTTWHLARDYCESLGGHLLRIESPAENNFVSRSFPIENIWIDATDAEKEGVWTNSKKKPLRYTNWAPGQPNGHGHDPNKAHAGYLFNGDPQRNPHGWYNVPSGIRMPFICEWDE